MPATTTIVVLTSPRSKSYLLDTLASLNRAGAATVRARFVAIDGTLPIGTLAAITALNWRTLPLSDTPAGNLAAFFRVLEYGTTHFTNDQLLFFEDDVVLCKNAIARMLETGVPDACAFTSFFDMKEMDTARFLDQGLYRVSAMGVDGRGYWGSQALLWPRRTMAWLCDRKAAIFKGESKHSSDCIFGSHLLYSPWPEYALHVPNLVEHVGDVSAIWSWVPKVNRQATSFLGEDFDAASLPVFK